jgi:hypothetical protein
VLAWRQGDAAGALAEPHRRARGASDLELADVETGGKARQRRIPVENQVAFEGALKHRILSQQGAGVVSLAEDLHAEKAGRNHLAALCVPDKELGLCQVVGQLDDVADVHQK